LTGHASFGIAISIRKLRVVTKIGSADSSAIPPLSQGILHPGSVLSEIQNYLLNLNRSELYFSSQLLTREGRRKTTTPGADFIL